MKAPGSKVQPLDVAALPGVRLEAPGGVSFDCLTHEYCDMLLAEAKHYQACGLPQRAPNSKSKNVQIASLAQRGSSSRKGKSKK